MGGPEKARGTVTSWQTPSPASEPGAGAPGASIIAGLALAVQAREQRTWDRIVVVWFAIVAGGRRTSARVAIAGSGTARAGVAKKLASRAGVLRGGVISVAIGGG